MKTVLRFAGPFLLGAWLVLGRVVPSPAQSVVMPMTANPVASRIAPDADSVSPPAASSLGSVLLNEGPLIQRGSLAVRPHADYRAIYAEGLQAGPGKPVNTFIQSFSPGFLLEFGRDWTLDYIPTWTYYSNSLFHNTFEQAANLNVHVPTTWGTVGGAQSYGSSDDMLVETGGQTHQEKYTSLIDATYNLGNHAQLETSIDRSVLNTTTVAGSPGWTASNWVQWTADAWLRYEFSSRLSASAGLTVGKADMAVGTDMNFVLPQVKLSWKLGDKITLDAEAGEEIRHFKNKASPPLKSPVYTAAAGYQIFPTTKLSLSGSRTVTASYFANEVTRGDGWVAGLEQRLFQHFYLEASFTEQGTHYLSVGALAPGPRNDRYRSIDLRLTTIVLHRVTFALIFQTGRNSSDLSAYIFRSDQYGVEAGIRF